MNEQTTHPTGLSADVHAIIGIVLEALAIPHAATVAHEQTRAKILDKRVMCTVVVLRGIATRDRGDDLVGDLAYLRKQLAEHPAEGYVTAEQARARCDAGADWMDAVSLDYDGPAIDAADEGEASATIPGTWPGGEPASVRDAETSNQEAREIADVRDLATKVRAAAGRIGHSALFWAAHAMVAAVDEIQPGADPTRRDGMIAQVRASAGEVVTILDEIDRPHGENAGGGYLIPPPADPALRAEWEAGVAARDAAGLSGFVGEDYPGEGGRS